MALKCSKNARKWLLNALNDSKITLKSLQNSSKITQKCTFNCFIKRVESIDKNYVYPPSLFSHCCAQCVCVDAGNNCLEAKLQFTALKEDEANALLFFTQHHQKAESWNRLHFFSSFSHQTKSGQFKVNEPYKQSKSGLKIGLKMHENGLNLS